jgi:hypothetical protein
VLDRAKVTFGGNFSGAKVDSVKLVTRLAPFLVAMVPYWGIYSQMSTAFQNQVSVRHNSFPASPMVFRDVR